MNTQELFNHYYVQALANICEGDQAKMAHVLQVKQAAEAAPVAPAAEGGSLIPGVDNSMLYSALAGAGIGGIGGAALSKKNKLRNALIAALGGAGVGVGGKMLYDKFTAGPDEAAALGMEQAAQEAAAQQKIRQNAAANLKNMKPLENLTPLERLIPGQSKREDEQREMDARLFLRSMLLENQQKFGPSK